MPKLLITEADIIQFGAYREQDVIVAGYEVRSPGAAMTFIFQKEVQNPDPHPALQGMCAEINENTFYGGVTGFALDDAMSQLRVAFDPVKSGGIEILDLPVPAAATEEERMLLLQLSKAFANRRH